MRPRQEPREFPRTRADRRQTEEERQNRLIASSKRGRGRRIMELKRKIGEYKNWLENPSNHTRAQIDQIKKDLPGMIAELENLEKK